MFTRLRQTIVVALLGGLVCASLAQAQVTMTQTTVSVAVAQNATSVTVASATGISAGHLLLIDREALRVVAVSGTTLNVSRGQEGTAAGAHAVGAVVYAGIPSAFARGEVAGACTSTAEPFLPKVVLPTGNVYQCSAGNWEEIGSRVGTIQVACRTLLVADQIDQSCWTADRNYVLVRLTEVHTTAESGGTLTLIPTRQQSTEAAASGDALLAAAIDMVGAGATAQTVKTPALSATAANLLISTGERLGLDFTDDSAGELAGVTVTFTLVPR